MFRYHYGSLLYENQTRNLHKTEKYQNGLMPVAAKTVQTWANELPKKIRDKDGTEHKVGIVPTSISAMQYISNAKYLPGDTTLKAERIRDQNSAAYSLSKISLLLGRKFPVALALLMLDRYGTLLFGRSRY